MYERFVGFLSWMQEGGYVTGVRNWLDAVCGGFTLLSSHQSPKCILLDAFSGCILLPSYTDLGVTNELLSASLYHG